MNTTANYVDPIPNMGREGWYREAWMLFKKDSQVWMLATFVSGLIVFAVTIALELGMMIPTGIFSGRFSGHPATSTTPLTSGIELAGSVVQILLQCYFGAGLLKMAIASVRRQPIRYDMLFSGLPQSRSLFLYNLAVWLITFVAFFVPAFLMAPTIFTGGTPSATFIAVIILIGLIVSTLYLFIIPGEALVVDGVPVKDALRRSFAGVKQNVGYVIGAYLFSLLLTLLSVCTCYIGLLAVYPVLLMVVALAARDIAGLPVETIDTTYSQGVQYPGGPAVLPGAWPPAPSGVWPPPPTAAVPSEPPPVANEETPEIASAPEQTSPPPIADDVPKRDTSE